MVDYNSNVFIFNFIKNNEKDIALLKQTFEQFNCEVKLYQHLNSEEFRAAADFIRDCNFTMFKYIVIVILDNRNKYKHLLLTSDNHDVHFYRELFAYAQRNKTLAAKPLLFIMQTNQIIPETSVLDPGEHSVHSGTPIVRLYATQCEDEPLENHWQQENADESPFIKAFCKYFQANVCIGNICDKIVDELRESRDQPYKGGDSFGLKAVFGKAKNSD